jgi:hypothetical protein
MSCTPPSNSCPSASCDPDHEPLPSALDNFITQFFGEVTKTCVDGQIVWSLPCNLETGIPGYPRQEGEGLACYFKRVINDLFLQYGMLGTMAFQNANGVSITGGTITGLANPVNFSDAANKAYVDSVVGQNGPVFNVKDYGAIGNGVADDSAAISSALSAAQTTILDGSNSVVRAVVYFPRGNYRVTNAISVTAPIDSSAFNLQFRGDGMGLSVITQGTASTDGFLVTLTGSSATASMNRAVEFIDLTLRAGAACSRAIRIDYGTSTSFHQKPGSRLTRVSVESPTTSLYWSNGVQFINSWNSVVEGSFIAGNPTTDGSLSGRGIDLVGLCVNFVASNTQTNFWDIGLANINDSTSTSNQNNEGIVLDKMIMVPVRTGVSVKGNPNADPLALGLDWANRYITGRVALVALSESHIDARGDAGTAPVKLENVNAFMLSSNLLIASSGSSNFVYLNQAYEGTCTGNTFLGPTSVGVKVSGLSTNNTFTGNQFRQAGNASGPIAFEFDDTTTQYNIATNNTRENQYALVNNDWLYSTNQVGQALNISATVTTMGGAPYETFLVDISKAALGRKCPAIAVSLNSAVTNIEAVYVWDGIANSKTTASIRVFTLDGTNLPGGTTYRLGLSVNPGTY